MGINLDDFVIRKGSTGDVSGVTVDTATGLTGGGTSGDIPIAIGTVPLANGGTGATTASAARTALGLGTAATYDSSAFSAAAHTHTSYNNITSTTVTFEGTYLKLGAPGNFVIENLVQEGTNVGTDLSIKAGNAAGTDQTGGSLRLGAGSSTGGLYSGNVSIWGNPRGTAGNSSLNQSVEFATFNMNNAAPHLKFKETMKSIYGPDDADFGLRSYDDLTLQADAGSGSLSSEINMKIQAQIWWSLDDVGRQYAGTALDLGPGPLTYDSTLTRLSAGDLGIEGNIIYRAGGTDVPIADGGTGASTLAAAKTALEIPVDLTVSGAGTVHADNYSGGTTYSLATASTSGLCQVYNTVEEESIVCDPEEELADPRRYKIQHDTDTDLSVCVPWTDTTYTLPAATTSAIGGLKVAATPNGSVPSPLVASPTSGRTYQLESASNGTGLVYVPWTDTQLTIGTGSGEAMAGNTTTITPAQAGAITANTAKISYSTAASDAVALNTAKTTAHTLIDSDTMSGASATNVASAESVKAYVDGKYSYSYIMWHGRNSNSDDYWAFPDATTDGEFNWEDDDEQYNAWDGNNNGIDNDGTNTTAGVSTVSIPRDIGVMGVVIPYDCQLVGFTAIGRDLSGNDPFKAGLWTSPDFDEYGGNTTNTDWTLRAVATATYSGGGGVSYNGICKLEDLTADYELNAGTILLPSLSEYDASRSYVTMTIVLKVPLVA